MFIFEPWTNRYEARLVAVGYIHKFIVMINHMEVIYELDEERNYRAILNEADQAKVGTKLS